MEMLLSGLLLTAIAIWPASAIAQPADTIPDANETGRQGDPVAGAGAESEQADEGQQARDGGSRQRPRNPRPSNKASGTSPAEAAARAAAVRAARSNANTSFTNFTGEMAASPNADLRQIEAKGDEALRVRGRAISPAGQALDKGKAPVAAGRIGPDDSKAFGAAAKHDGAAKLARMRAAREAAQSRGAARIARSAKAARGLGSALSGAAIGTLAVLPTMIEVTTGADIGLERYVFDAGKAIVTGDSAAMVAANEDLGERAVDVGESIAETVQDPSRIGDNVEQTGKDLAQTGADVGAAVTEAVSDPAKLGRDAGKAACSIGSFFTGGEC